MKVSSPIGDLPFKPTKLGLHNNGMRIEGNMGAWPAEVQISLTDLCEILYLLRYVILSISFLAGLVVLIKRMTQ